MTLLNSYEMEFLAELCEVMTTNECNYKCITVWKEDTKDCMMFTDEAQEIFNDLYNRYEDMYINIVKRNIVKKPLMTKTKQKEIDDHLKNLISFWGMSW